MTEQLLETTTRNRRCLICAMPVSAAHLGMDSCRFVGSSRLFLLNIHFTNSFFEPIASSESYLIIMTVSNRFLIGSYCSYANWSARVLDSSSRACASFFKRTKLSGKKFACRAGTHRCSTLKGSLIIVQVLTKWVCWEFLFSDRICTYAHNSSSKSGLSLAHPFKQSLPNMRVIKLCQMRGNDPRSN